MYWLPLEKSFHASYIIKCLLLNSHRLRQNDLYNIMKDWKSVLSLAKNNFYPVITIDAQVVK
jgi:hypothetical protein